MATMRRNFVKSSQNIPLRDNRGSNYFSEKAEAFCKAWGSLKRAIRKYRLHRVGGVNPSPTATEYAERVAKLQHAHFYISYWVKSAKVSLRTAS